MKEYVIGGGGFLRFLMGFILSMLLLVVLLLTALGYGLAFHPRPGPEEPIPFSHRVHAGEKEIGCVMCHDSVFTEASAGIPPLETCMLCHSRLIVTLPQIRKLRDHYYNKKPVFWRRAAWAGSGNLFPDFVYFNHSVHLNRSVDCGHCHGPVNRMDRIVPIQELNMGFCVNCHKHYNASHDCFTCHR